MLARFFVVQHQPPFVTPVGEPQELGAMEEWIRFFFLHCLHTGLTRNGCARHDDVLACMVGSLIEHSLTGLVRVQEIIDRRQDSASGRWPCSV